MIRNAQQYNLTAASIAHFEAAIAKATAEGPGPGNNQVMFQSYIDGMKSQVETLKEQMLEFEQTPPTSDTVLAPMFDWGQLDHCELNFYFNLDGLTIAMDEEKEEVLRVVAKAVRRSFVQNFRLIPFIKTIAESDGFHSYDTLEDPEVTESPEGNALFSVGVRSVHNFTQEAVDAFREHALRSTDIPACAGHKLELVKVELFRAYTAYRRDDLGPNGDIGLAAKIADD